MYDRVDRIDGLRAFAVGGVIAIHTTLLTEQHAFTRLFYQGQMGVELFFILSGYVISLAWDRSNKSLSDFYFRRVLRLAPLYYVLLAATYLFNWSNRTDLLDWQNLVWHALWMQGFSATYQYVGIGPMWSLTPEVVFYLVFPLLWRLSSRSLVIILALGWIIPARGLDPEFHALTGLTQLSTSPLGSIKYLIGGMLIYRYRDALSTPAAVTASGLFALMFLGVVAQGAIGHHVRLALPSSADTLLLSAPFLLFSTSRIASALFDNVVARHIGVVSYSAYLVQIPIVMELAKRGLFPLSPQTAFPLLLMLTVLISTVTYYVIERPFLRWNARRRPETATPSTSPRSARMASAG